MPHKDYFLIHQRDTAIRRAYAGYIKSGMSCMRAYSLLAREYYLGTDRIRQIIAYR